MAMRWRQVAVIIGVGAAAGVLASACLPNPANDFDDYANRTASFRETNTADAAPIDSQAPTQAVTGIYYSACLSQLAINQVSRVLSFYVETSFTPDPAGGGKLSLTFTPLKLGNPCPSGTCTGAPNAVSKANTDGQTFNITDVPVDAKGVFQPANIPGVVAVPADCNPISHRDITINSAAIPGRFQEQQFCTKLSGNVTVPVTIVLDPSMNTCLFFAVKDGDPPPALTSDMFASNCPLN